MDTLMEAHEAMEWANSDDISDAVMDYYIRKAQALAAIAQAEQLKRIADASERQAVAVERRNEILEEYNRVSHEQHLVYRSEVIDFFRQFFGAAESEE